MYQKKEQMVKKKEIQACTASVFPTCPAALLPISIRCTSVLAQAPGYNCPRSCKTPNCYCASHEIPGGLKPRDTPQFVVLVRRVQALQWA